MTIKRDEFPHNHNSTNVISTNKSVKSDETDHTHDVNDCAGTTFTCYTGTSLFCTDSGIMYRATTCTTPVGRFKKDDRSHGHIYTAVSGTSTNCYTVSTCSGAIVTGYSSTASKTLSGW